MERPETDLSSGQVSNIPEPWGAVSKRFCHLLYRIFSGRHYLWLLRLKATFSCGGGGSRVSSGKGQFWAPSWLQRFLPKILEEVASSP